MAGVQFDSTDEPVFNSFDLPTICDGADDAERSCCDPCEELLFCLKRTPIEIHLPGLDLGRWLPCVSFACSKILQASGIGGTLSGGGETDVFNGVFLALTANATLTSGDCGLRGETTLCADAWPDDAYGGGSVPLTHTTSLGRTIYAPGADGGQSKKLKLALNTECVTVESVQYVKFTVILVFEFERQEAICIEACEYGGFAIDDPAIVGALEADGWGAGCYSVGCCPIAESALIPLVGLVWADLADIPLTAVDPPNWALVDAMDPTGPWELVDGNACGAVEAGFVKAVPYSNSDPGCDGGPYTGHHETGNTGCEHPNEGDATVWTEVNQLDCGPLHVWIPPPIVLNAGDAFLKVLASGCLPAAKCASCIPDPIEAPHAAVPLISGTTVYYEATGGCTKTFTPVFPACAEISHVYWPWGEVSLGDDSVTHTLVNLAADGISIEETITAIFYSETRGCIYCDTETHTCGCCPGTTGSLEIVSTGVNEFELCATTNGAPVSGPCVGEATVISFTGAGITPASGSIGNGDCLAIEVTGANPTVTWWVEDGNGCEGEHVTQSLWRVTCECCIAAINAMSLTVSGWITFDAVICARCDDINATYELRPDNLTATCLWEYQSALGDGPDIECLADACDPPGGCPPYVVGVEIFVQILCIGDDQLLLLATVNMSEGYATYYQLVSCPGCDGANPGDCSTLGGTLTLDALGIYGPAPIVGGCDPIPGSVFLEITFGG